MHFRDLKADEIDVRIGQVGNDWATLLLYKDARVDMDILDETVGSENWQRKHYEVKGNMYCSVGINCGKGEQSEWVWKDDCGTESNTEKEKGESSDSFKRACVNWGIGRELYTSPKIFINCDTKDKKLVHISGFKVESITIKDKTIVALTVLGYYKQEKKWKTVYTFGDKGNNTAHNENDEVKSRVQTKLDVVKDIIKGSEFDMDCVTDYIKQKWGEEIAINKLSEEQFTHLVTTLRRNVKKIA